MATANAVLQLKQTIWKRLLFFYTFFPSIYTLTQVAGSLLRLHPWIKNKEQNSPICCSSFGRRKGRHRKDCRDPLYFQQAQKLLYVLFVFVFCLYYYVNETNNMADTTSGRSSTITGVGCNMNAFLIPQVRPSSGLTKPVSQMPADPKNPQNPQRQMAAWQSIRRSDHKNQFPPTEL